MAKFVRLDSSAKQDILLAQIGAAAMCAGQIIAEN